MTGYDIMNAIHKILELGDNLDSSGGGAKGLSNGDMSTREVCRVELIQFLFYIADGCTFLTDGQATVLNIVLDDGESSIPASIMRDVVRKMSKPKVENNISVLAFCLGDKLLTEKTGRESTDCIDALLNLYDFLGGLIITMNRSSEAQSRFDHFMDGLRKRAALAASKSWIQRDNTSLRSEEKKKYNPEPVEQKPQELSEENTMRRRRRRQVQGVQDASSPQIMQAAEPVATGINSSVSAVRDELPVRRRRRPVQTQPMEDVQQVSAAQPVRRIPEIAKPVANYSVVANKIQSEKSDDANTATVFDWKTLFSKTILERGHKYYRDGKVKILTRYDDMFLAEVNGSNTYEVCIHCPNRRIQLLHCDCPYAEELNNCKHMAALMYALEDEGVVFKGKLRIPEKKKGAPRTKAKATTPVKTSPNASKECGANEILALSPDRDLIQSLSSRFNHVKVERYAEDSEYWFATFPRDKESILSEFKDLAYRLAGRGVAMEFVVDNDHDYEGVSFFDGRNVWSGDHRDLYRQYVTGEWEAEAEEWLDYTVGDNNQRWSTQKRIFNQIKKRLAVYTLKDMVEFFEKELKK